MIRRPGADHVAIWIQIASSLDRAHAAEPPPALRTTSRVAVGDKGEIKRKFSFVISTAMRLRVYIYIYTRLRFLTRARLRTTGFTPLRLRPYIGAGIGSATVLFALEITSSCHG